MKNCPEMNKIWQCVGFGLCAFDYLAIVEKYPALNQKTDCVAYSQQGGGPVATALATLGRLGMNKIAFVGKVGADAEGGFIRRALEQDGVDTRYLKEVSGTPSAQAFVWIEKSSGKRSVVLHRDERLFFSADEIQSEPFEHAAFLLVDGRDTDAALKSVVLAKKANAKVVMDAGSVRPKIDRFFRLVDYFICSKDFLRDFNHGNAMDDAMRKIQRMGSEWVVVTLGDEGSIGFDGQQFYHEPAFPVPVVDTTGAGDVYHGAFIFGLSKKWRLPQIMKFANAVAALKCGKLGGREGIPASEDVKLFLESKLEQNQNNESWLQTW